jgi:hypothetical protein
MMLDLTTGMRPNHFRAGVAISRQDKFIYLDFTYEEGEIEVKMPVLLTPKQARNVIEGIEKALAKFVELDASN